MPSNTLQDICGDAAQKSERTYLSQLRLALLKREEVLERIKISRAALYAKLNPVDPAFDPAFPVPIRIGSRAVRWIESEVEVYIASLPRARQIGGEA